jgi:ABC-2 type transport system ATP-binding protein
VVLTTHYMEEAEVLCDRLVIIDHGRIIAQGTPRDMVATLGAEQVIELEAEPPPPRERLERLPSVVAVQQQDARLSLRVREPHVALPALLREVEATGGVLRHLSTRRPTLDDVFLGLTGRSLREGAKAA